MSLRRLSASIAVLLAFAAAHRVAAQTAPDPSASVLYSVAAPSDYETGCFGPCACPVQIQDALLGTFVLTPTAPDPLFANYAVTDINWMLTRTGVRITGSGTYKIGGEFALTQELVLDLVVDGQGKQHFDSGVVPVSAPFPAIDAVVSLNNFTCQDTRLHVVSKPVPLTGVPYVLLGSHYEVGCFDGCECPIVSEPLLGRFGLLKLQDAAGAVDFAVVDIRWLVRRAWEVAATDATPVTGSGMYHVVPGPAGAAGSGTQRMVLDLLENGAGPTRFDSGTVPWSGVLRKIDVDLAANGFACSDRVYSIHARRVNATATDLFGLTPEPFKPGVAPAP